MSESLRIMQVLPELNAGGVETGTVDFARYLHDHGYFSIVVSNGGRLVGGLERSGMRHETMPVHKKNIFTAVKCIRPLRELILRERIDIVHARSRVPAWIAFFACRHTPAQFITTCHGHYSVSFFSKVMAFPKLIIAPSRVIGRHMIERFQYDPQNIRYIPRSVDLDRFPFRQPRADTGRSVPVITIVGRLTPLKGHVYFLKAMAKVVRSMPYIKIRVVGSPPKKKEDYLKELQVMARHLGLGELVEFLGDRKDVPQLLADSDVLVMSSIVPEAFGRVILEAQAVGVPVVATSIGGAAEIIEDGRTGLLVLPKDTDAMAQAVLQVLQDKPLARSMAEAARQKVEKMYTVEQMCSRTVTVYHELRAKQTILVIKIGALGDVILVTPSLKALRRKFPSARICCLVGEASQAVLQKCPYVDELIVADFKSRHKGVWGMLKLARQLRKEHFDKVIDFQNSRRSHILGAACLAKNFLGYRRKWGFLLTDPVELPDEKIPPVQHQFCVLGLLGIPYDPRLRLDMQIPAVDRKKAVQMLASEWISEGMRVVGVHIAASAGWETKNWCHTAIAELCDRLAQENIRTVLTGAEKDRPAAAAVLERTRSKPANFVGRTTIMELAAVIKRCAVYVTPDSSPLHIAAAVGTPFVALFGPTDPARHLPPADHGAVIQREMDCIPCYKGKFCRTLNHACLEEISAGEVFEQILDLMSETIGAGEGRE
ncbi:MAG: lipopolysaccharide heptosyltransferase II [Candidatus Omnitrophota bacterium]